MKDYEYYFATLLHTKLKEKLVGKIFVAVDRNDGLIVNINSYGDINFKTRFDNFSERLLNGWSADYVVYEFKKQFEKYLKQKYFK